MSGHSKWATTKHKKALVDSKRAKVFTKLQKEILVAAKMGDPNPDFNPRLRNAVIAAKAASIVEALTDNKNRTASNVRSYFTKANGVLAETGSVSFMFEKVGVIGYEGSKIKEDEMFELALECGADNVDSSEEWHEIITSLSDFASVRDALIEKLGDPNEAKIEWRPKEKNIIDDFEKAEKIQRLIDRLEDDDDVQSVVTNVEFSDEIMEKLGE